MARFTFSVVSFFDLGPIALVSAVQLTLVVISLAVGSANGVERISKTVTGQFTSLLTGHAHTVVCLVDL